MLLVLLCVSLQPRVSAVNLRRFIGCAVREFTFLARKPGCGGLHITTDACWGRCETWEVSSWEAATVLCFLQELMLEDREKRRKD